MINDIIFILKALIALCIIKQSIKKKKTFSKSGPQWLNRTEILTNHHKVCSEINGKQSIKIPEEGAEVKFINHSRQLPALFTAYAI